LGNVAAPFIDPPPRLPGKIINCSALRLNLMDNQKGNQAADTLLSAWIKSAADFWGSMLQNWTKKDAAGGDSAGGEKSRTQESFETVFNSWQTLSSVAGDSGAMEAFSNLGRALPEILLQMVEASWRSYFYLQQQWLEKAGRIGESTRAFNFDNLDEEVFKAWTEIYEKEFRQFFHIPQLGLTRFYQEKINATLDKHNRFQSHYAEFMHLILLPVEKSFKVFQQQLSAMAQEGKLPENSNDFYKVYIKILEGHYMSLFKSPDYVKAMGNTLGALEDFVEARNAIGQDILKAMAVPTQNELDELYKEMYQLKKRIKILEKEKQVLQSDNQKL
jgi:poly[(R)-3-hydroxyalkanoate] polymerase subunit PhaE